jgi:hypothetical protein
VSRNFDWHRESRPKTLENRTLRVEPLEPRWLCAAAANYLGLADAALAAYVKNLAADGSINRSDMICILRSVQNESDGNVNSTDLSDLRKIVQNASNLNMPNYVSVLASDVVNGSTANARFQGAALGNLAVGSSNAKLGKLVDKWFYGADVPSWGSYAYATVSGKLYGSSGPSHLDEKQGALGDCYLIAALGSLADSSQAAIKNMIFDNYDGTWTVRFFYNGTPDYVTVFRALPVSGGHLIFDGYGSSYSASNNVLWLALLEKAYAQWNETGKTQRGSYSNSYSAIEGGWMGDVYQQALGYSTVYAMQTSTWNAKTTLISALSNHRAATIGTVHTPQSSTGLYGNHAYDVLSYSSSTGKFTLYNPWGCCQPQQLTWTQLSANADWLSTTATTSTPAWLAKSVSHATALAAPWDAGVTMASTMDAPITPSRPDALPAAVDAALSDRDSLWLDGQWTTATALRLNKSLPSDAAGIAAISPGNGFANVDVWLDLIPLHSATAF